MKWKQFWKTTNRGVWLTLIVLVGMVIYIGVGNYQFKNKHAKDISETVKAYLEEMKNFNLATPEQAAQGYSLTPEQAKEKLTQLQDMGKKYWTNVFEAEPSWDEHPYHYARFQEEVGWWYERLTEMDSADSYPCLLEKYEFILGRVKVKRNGPNAAILTATMKRDLVGPPEGIYMGIATVGYLEDFNGTVVDGMCVNSGEYELAVELAYVDGTWKISYIDLYLK